MASYDSTNKPHLAIGNWGIPSLRIVAAMSNFETSVTSTTNVYP
jgi:hypothetical protein